MVALAGAQLKRRIDRRGDLDLTRLDQNLRGAARVAGEDRLAPRVGRGVMRGL